MDYIDKYNKYKYKYEKLLEIIGGGNKKDKFLEIINFIKKSKKNEIQKNLLAVISNKKFCPTVLGEGAFGLVVKPSNFGGNKIKVKINNMELELPIVIKKSKNIFNKDIYFAMEILDNILYITGYRDITPEVIILSYVRQLWHKSVHLPLIIGYGTCEKSQLVDRLITYRYGLSYNVKINLKNKIYDERPIWNPKFANNDDFISNNLSTLRQLFLFIYYNNKNGIITFPNKKKCNVSELFDYICISYITTHQLLAKNNIFISDMHQDNIFIHWLNESSYYNNKNIKNIEEIYYKVGKKYYKIKTFGFVIVLGDLGTSIIKCKKDVILCGQLYDIKKNYKLIKKKLNPNFNVIEFIRWNSRLVQLKYFKKTVAYTILYSVEPYNNMIEYDYILLGELNTILDKQKSPIELLKFYDKYLGKTYKKKENNILLEI